MGVLSNSPLHFLGHEQKDGLHYYFGVPQGCVVRNTFLEWKESEESTPAELNGTPLTAELKATQGHRGLRRAKSLPQEIMMSTIRSIAQEDEASGDEQHGPQRRDFLSRSLPTTPVHGDDEQENATSFDGSPVCSTGPPSEGRSEHGQSQQQKPSKNRASGGASLVLRGLPFNVSDADVLAFIEQAGCTKFLAKSNNPITLLSNAQGRPSGFAEVQLAHSSDFWEVQEKLHMKPLGARYVEALPPRGGKDRWGMNPGSQRAAKRDSWRRLKGQSGDSNARWHQQHHNQNGAASPDWANWSY